MRAKSAMSPGVVECFPIFQMAELVAASASLIILMLILVQCTYMYLQFDPAVTKIIPSPNNHDCTVLIVMTH